jgi:hypothetical protein
MHQRPVMSAGNLKTSNLGDADFFEVDLSQRNRYWGNAPSEQDDAVISPQK